jgi:hypothetical protein
VNAELYCKLGLPFVMGTTGGDKQLLYKSVQDSKNYALVSPQMGKQVYCKESYSLMKLKNILLYFFFEKYSTNADTHTRMSTHPYEHMHAYSTPMNITERLSRLDLEIYEVGH